MESDRIVPASYEAVICKCVLAVILLRRIRHGACGQFDDCVEEPVCSARVSPLSTSYPVGPHGCLTTMPLAKDGLQGSRIRLKYRRISTKAGNDLNLPVRVGIGGWRGRPDAGFSAASPGIRPCTRKRHNDTNNLRTSATMAIRRMRPAAPLAHSLRRVHRGGSLLGCRLADISETQPIR
jgi:hypothetical protein